MFINSATFLHFMTVLKLWFSESSSSARVEQIEVYTNLSSLYPSDIKATGFSKAQTVL